MFAGGARIMEMVLASVDKLTAYLRQTDNEIFYKCKKFLNWLDHLHFESANFGLQRIKDLD